MFFDLKKFLGIEEMPDKAQKLILRIFPLMSLFFLFNGLGNSFVILAFINSFGFGTAGFLMAVLFTSQFLTDYPAGSLADYIGQKYVISFSLVFLGAGYYLISYYANYNFYFFAALCIGAGLGQLNGAFASFLDNNYKKVMKDRDQDRKMYGFMYQRITIIGSLSMAFSFIIGGLISSFYSRTILFQIQGLVLLLLIPFILKFLNDVPDEEQSNTSIKKTNFFSNIKGGFIFLVSSKESFFLIIGLSMLTTVVGIWGFLFLFPLYFGYTGNDAGVGTFRAIIFLIGSIVIIYIARYQKKLKNDYLGKMAVIWSIGFFLGIILIVTFVPMNNSFNILGMILVLMVMTVGNNIVGAFFLILQQRVLSVKVPSEIRNSVYSLITTIGALIQIPLLPFIGNVVEFSGFAIGVVKFSGFAIGLGILLLLSLSASCIILIYHYYENKQDMQSHIIEYKSQSAEPQIID